MNWFFDMDRPVMRALSIMADLLVLNILTVLCSLPVLTAGAALTALSDACLRLVRQEDGALGRDYFRAFRDNFKKGTLLWLMLLAAALLLYFDYCAALSFVPQLRAGIIAIGILVLALAFYAFGLLARYENTLRGTVKNAAKLAVAFFPRTVLVVVFTVTFWLLCVRFFKFGSLILLLFGLALPVYVCAIILNDVFGKIEK